MSKLTESTNVEVLDLKRVVAFSNEALAAMYRVAPLGTWAIFVSEEQDYLARKLLTAFRRQMQKFESNDPVTKAPKIFAVPMATDEAGLRDAWQKELTQKVRVMSKMQA